MPRSISHMSIAEAIADREAQSYYAMMTGFPLIETPAQLERNARRARWERRKAK